MSCEIEWILRPEISSLYALWLQQQRQEIHNQNVADALRNFATDDSDPTRLIVKCMDDDAYIETETVQQVHKSVTAAVPQLEGELATRQAPLKMQWQARGPGMLNTIAKSVVARGEEFQSKKIRIWLVQPWTGGRMILFPGQGAVASLLFEAVITDVIPELPEVARMAWGISRLCSNSGDKDMLSDVLQAAESVGLTQNDSATLEVAQQEWLG